MPDMNLAVIALATLVWDSASLLGVRMAADFIISSFLKSVVSSFD